MLSPTTERYDRGKKFGHYQQVESLREYVLVSQDEVRVDRYVRQDGGWLLTVYQRREDVLPLSSVGVEVPLRDIYARVDCPTAETSQATPASPVHLRGDGPRNPRCPLEFGPIRFILLLALPVPDGPGDNLKPGGRRAVRATGGSSSGVELPRCQRGCRGFKSHLPLHFHLPGWRQTRERLGCVVADRPSQPADARRTPSMSTGEQADSPATAEAEPETPEAEAKPKLALDVQIKDVGPCKKHVSVAIPRADVERQFGESLGEMTKEAHVPGFRPGHAPKGLVEKRFRKEVANQVKSALLMASLEQLDEDYKLNPITQPQLDVAAIELPKDGPMNFEMDVEVRPDFAVPAYKAADGQAGDEDDRRARRRRRAHDLPRAVRSTRAQARRRGRNRRLHHRRPEVPQGRCGTESGQGDPVPAPYRASVPGRHHIPDLESVLKGVKPGETREAIAQIGSGSPDARLRGQSIGVTVVVHDLKTLRMPTVDDAFLRGIGFDDPADLREGLRGVLERRLEFQKREALKREIVDQLLDKTPIDLPADLVSRQEQQTLRRRYHELRESGLDDSAIRAREAQIRANVHESTLQSLKEFFLLAKIAEAEGIKVEDEDLETEILALADRTDESPRRVRARVQKEGLEDMLASQILERKTIDRIAEYVKFEDIALPQECDTVETIDQTAGAWRPEEPEDAPARRGFGRSLADGKGEISAEVEGQRSGDRRSAERGDRNGLRVCSPRSVPCPGFFRLARRRRGYRCAS